jgi:activator of 2-hydroxyglutaryl-CoA dehydratase
MDNKGILKINVLFYHGTNSENIQGIIENGFSEDSISCATMDRYYATGYGDSLIKFKYPVNITFNNIFYFIKEYFNKSLTIGVSGFKPNYINLIPYIR